MIPLQLAAVNSVVFSVKATDADEDVLLYMIDKASVLFNTLNHTVSNKHLTTVFRKLTN